ncbi:MAG: hypothetical protein COT09_04175 [Candidatus Hydromicrobium americanum]|nr:MAG: hypothetical protein COT09_04175 [Candidatus Hydromicrobium americanum]
MDNISSLRKNIYNLERQRKIIIDYLLNAHDMVDGSIYTVYKKCGNKNCRCAKGELHGPFKYLSKKVDGKTKLTFVRKADEPGVEIKATNYRKYINHMARLGKIDKKIYEMVVMIKKIKTSSYEPAKK